MRPLCINLWTVVKPVLRYNVCMHFDMGGNHRCLWLIGQHFAKAPIKARSAMPQCPAQWVGQAWELPDRWQPRHIDLANAHLIYNINQLAPTFEQARWRA